jgi:ATP-dependent DNA helicase RecQ
VLIERKPIAIMLPEGKAKTEAESGAGHALEDIDTALYERLRNLRLNLARAAQLPAYMVFTDAALHAMCKILPKNKREFLTVPGVAKVKAEKYAEPFTSLIREYTTNSVQKS